MHFITKYAILIVLVDKEILMETLQEQRPKRTQIMTLKEAAKYLGVHTITVYRLIQSSDMPVFKLGGQWRFKKDLLDNWLVDRMNKRVVKVKK